MTGFTLRLMLAAVTMHWTPQTGNSIAGLRGVAVVSQKVVWVSGTQGTVLRTVDGGKHWEARKVGGAEGLDFRDVEAFDGNMALVVASGLGDASWVYLTTNGGNAWTLVLRNPESAGFFDAMKFWDRNHGILVGDPVAGHFTIYTTNNGGLKWTLANQPAAVAGEGAFAASGTCLTVRDNHDAWFGTGGRGLARVFHTADQGQSWTVAGTPLSGRTASSGIFGLVFPDSDHGVAVGGDYATPDQSAPTVAVTSDGGFTWTVSRYGIPGGFRSAVTYVKPKKMLIAVGTSGSDYSMDGGLTWTKLSTDTLNAVANAGSEVWAVGPNGLILKLVSGR